MTRTALAGAMVVLMAGTGAAQEWRTVWSDEFVASSIDITKWTHEVNGSGGGNNELQYYTARPQNSFIRDGKLVIRAIKETFTGPDGTRGYTSARLNTRYKGDWLYGRMEARLKVPGRQGTWPAFWMLPTDFEYGGWAASGEIDIMEHRGDQPRTLHTTIHHGGPWPNNTYTGGTYEGPDFSADFHEFAVEWEPNQIRWYLDGNQVYSLTQWYSTAAPYPAPFNKRFHILLNLAIGGNFLPNPPADADYFPREYEIDWVRVYERVQDPTAQSPFGGTRHPIPGTIRAEAFDLGGQDVAYHDTTIANQFASARLTEGVDLEPSNDGSGTHNVGGIEAGEWLEYAVDVQQGGGYRITARIASPTAGAAVTIKFTDATQRVRMVYATLPATGSADTWQEVDLGTLDLPAGSHTMRVVAEAPGFKLSTLQLALPAQGPYGTAPQTIPGRIVMQDYDTGGQGVAYNDTDATNIGGAYRPAEGVDLGPSNDIGGGNSIGWFAPGEWVEYTVTVEQAGTYAVTARTASESQSGTLALTFTAPGRNDGTVSNSVPATGGWTTWRTHPIGTVSLAAGRQVLRLELISGSANANHLDFTLVTPAVMSDLWIIHGS